MRKGIFLRLLMAGFFIFGIVSNAYSNCFSVSGGYSAGPTIFYALVPSNVNVTVGACTGFLNYLEVGGGGAGGADTGGGGGGGGVVYGKYDIHSGDGFTGNAGNGGGSVSGCWPTSGMCPGGNGNGNSSILYSPAYPNGQFASGGGRGGQRTPGCQGGNNGGSGGGGSHGAGAYPGGTGGIGGLGNSGGWGWEAATGSGGGGGGGGGVGSNAPADFWGGDGGPGFGSFIMGSVNYYGGGGGGNSAGQGGIGGIGGGGSAGNVGTPYTGGGGGGGHYGNCGASPIGGSGIVILNFTQILPISLTGGVSTTWSGSAGLTGSADGTGTAARFNSPMGVAIDGTLGISYVADTGNHTIRMVNLSSGAVTTIAGSAGLAGSADGTGAAARFNSPIGIAINNYNMFVADTGNHTIRMVNLNSGAVTTIAGSAGLAGSADGTGAAARFNSPMGVATDGISLYVADTGNHTIRMVNLVSGAVTTIAGSAGLAGSADGTGAAARFNLPIGIALSSWCLYVADTGNHTIRVVNLSGAVTTMAGSAGLAGSADGTGAAARFNLPIGIALSSSYLYVADTGNHTIRMVNLGSGAVTTIAGSAGLAGSADGTGTAARFNLPIGVMVDSGYLNVTEFNNHTIRRVNSTTTTLIVSKSGDGTGTITSDFGALNCGATCSIAYLGTVTLSATPDTGKIFTGWSGTNCSGTGTCILSLSSGATQNITATFVSSGIVVTPSTNGNGSISPATPQNINIGSQTTFTVTPATGYTALVGGTCGGTLVGTIYTTKTLTTDCTIVVNFTPQIFFPQYSVSVNSNGFGSGIISSNPSGISYSYPAASQGLLSLSGGAVITITATANTGSLVSFGGTCTVQGGIEVNDNTTIAMCSFSSLRFSQNITATFNLSSGGTGINLGNKNVKNIAGSVGVAGSTDGTGSAARFNIPTGITSDGINLYVADTGNDTIRKIVISTGAVTTVAGSALKAGFVDGTGMAANFFSPVGLSTDGVNLYIVDSGNDIVRQMNFLTSAVTTMAGTAGFKSTSDGTGTNASFNVPFGIATDGTNLYVSEYGGHTIRKIVISTGVVTTVAGSAGVAGSVDGVGSAARFKNPTYLASDGINLYVADTGNHTIRKVVISTGAVTTMAGSAGVAGSTDGTGTAARFNLPMGIASDGTNLYVSDFGNHTIRKIVISTGAVTTIAGTVGKRGLIDAAGTAAKFFSPEGLTTDGVNLYVTEYGNDTIRKISQ